MPNNTTPKSYTIGTITAISLSFVLFFSFLNLTSTQAAPPVPARFVPQNPTPQPPPNTHTASPNTAVSVTYSESISPTTVNSQTFVIQGMQTGFTVGDYAVIGGQMGLTPANPFKSGELIQVSATTGTLNLSGEGPLSPTVWQFRVAPAGGSGLFEQNQSFGGNLRTFSLTLGDVDDDGDLDAFVGNFLGTDKIWLNDGSGFFSDSGQTLTGLSTFGIALGDLDNDTDLDAYIADADTYDTVWLNENGIFSATNQPTLGSPSSTRVVFGDLNGDGYLDTVVGSSISNLILINDGSGIFAQTQSFTSNGTIEIALGDIDNDNDLDAFVVNSSGGDTVWWNDGLGNFSDSGQLLGTDVGISVALGDIDSDDDLDVFVANTGPNVVWVNEGGIFTSTQTLGNASSFSVVFGDMDSDGDLDAVVANDDTTNEIWLNDGAGNFSQGNSFGTSANRILDIGDLDGDNDLDILVGLRDAPDQVWLNRNSADVSLNQTVSSNSAVPGEMITYTLTYANNGPQAASDVVIDSLIPAGVTPLGYTSSPLVTATTGTTYTWELGTLAVDDTGVITISAMVNPASSGTLITHTATITTSSVDATPANNDTTTTVTVLNVAPVASDDNLAVVEENILNDTLVATDDNGDTLTYTLVTPTTFGNVSIQTNGDFTYTPINRISGYTDIFDFQVQDIDDLTDTGTVTITVTADNDAPTANDDAAPTTDEDTPVTGSLTFSDADTDDFWDYTLDTQAMSGTASIASDGTWTYTPTNQMSDYSDSFVLTVTDSGANSDNATITVAVTADNDPFTATDYVTATDEATSLSGQFSVDDPDRGDTASYTESARDAFGDLQLDTTGAWTYTPVDRAINYTDVFTISVVDNGANQAEFTLTVDVSASNTVPTANDDTFIITVNSSNNFLSVLANDEDTETEQTLTITAVDTPNQGGTVQISSGGTSLVYTPPTDYIGEEQFTYTISDGIDSDVGTVTTVVTGSPSLALDKTVEVVGGGPAFPGSTVIYTLAFTNSGEGPGLNVILTDNLPSEVAFAGFIQNDNLAATFTNSTVIWDLPTIAANETVTLIFSATVVNNISAAPISVTNTATNIATNASPGQAQATFEVQPLPLTFSKEASHPNGLDNLVVGDVVTYTFTLANPGPGDALNVVVSDILPAEVLFQGQTAPDFSLNGDTLIWTIDSIEGGTTLSRDFPVKLITSGKITNTATYTARNTDPGQAQATFEVQPLSLTFSKEASHPNGLDNLVVGDVVTYTLTLTNPGPGDALNVVVSDTVPAELILQGQPGTGSVVIGDTIVWTIETLPAGETLSLTFTTLITSSGQIVNTAIYTADNANPGEDSATITATDPTAGTTLYLPVIMKQFSN